MAVGGVDDVHVAPDEGAAGRGERGLGEGALRVVVVGVVVAVFVAGAGARREGGEGEGEQRRELHAALGRSRVGVGQARRGLEHNAQAIYIICRSPAVGAGGIDGMAIDRAAAEGVAVCARGGGSGSD